MSEQALTTEQQSPAPQAREKLPNHRVFTYALGDVANNLSFQMTSMFLMVYMTDIAGLGAGIAGTIYAVTKIWAGFTDLFAGQTVDRANTRWGRLRPWILFGATPLAIIFVLLFSVPAGLSATATVAWIFLFDAAFQLAYSFVNIPYGSLASAMTQDAVDRSRLSGARSIGSSITGVALSAVVAPQFQDTTADDVRLRFTLTCIGLGVLAVILYLICFANSREVVPRSVGKISIRRSLGMVRQNGPLLTLCAGAFFLLAAMFTMSAVAMYYARDVLGNAGWYTFLMLAQAVGTVLVASLVPGITVRFGKRKGYVGAAAVAILAFVLIYFVPPGSLPMAVVAWFVFGFGTGGTNALMFSMQADTVDYGEWKTGVRSEGGSYSILSFIRKCGQGIGGLVGAAVIGAFGYAAGSPTQSPEAMQGIRIACGAAPAVFAVLATLVMLRYPLTTETHRQLVEELNERRTRNVVKSALGVETEEIAAVELGDRRTTLIHTEGTAPVIITLFERDGAGAGEIGRMLADRLGVPFIDQKFSSERLAAADVQALTTDSGFDKWLRTMSYGATTDADLACGADIATNHTIATGNSQEVLSAVKQGGVILGRNATLVLANAVGALHVRLVAPIGKRIERVVARTGLSPSAAAERISIEDRIRAELSQRLYQWNPNHDEDYDLVINTGSITYEQVVDIIEEAYFSKYPRTTGGDEE
ncbi:MAG: glycoside-pentoside-hexuronide (GPH):cation symporter [Brooklawnia sp.]|uniref:glycoside-pentoside-hexuronide (GPH):cation symporter n=1 Tax=Brooklawnia sp. TaxID=2699740 RepID=UPI003C73DA5E